MRIKRGSVFEEIEYRILQALRVGMGRQMGRPAEKERRETVNGCEGVLLALEIAVGDLYDWVGEQSDRHLLAQSPLVEDEQSIMEVGRGQAYAKVRSKMRTLFSGLIDFEQKQEKQKNGL